MYKLLAILAFLFWVAPAHAQNFTVPTRPVGDNSNAAASTAFVQAAGGGIGVPQTPDTFLAGACGGSAALPAFRALCAQDFAGVDVSQALVTAAGQSIGRALAGWTGDVINVKGVNPAATGNGTTDDSAAFVAAFSQISNGGEVLIPCGVYKITQNLAISIALGKRAQLQGMGSDCTEIFFSGGAFGLTVNWPAAFATINAAGISFTTDQAGGGTAFKLVNNNVPTGAPANTPNGNTPFNNFYDIVFRGHDIQSASPTAWWSGGLIDIGVSNIDVWGGYCQGKINTQNGTCYSFSGSSSVPVVGSNQAIVANFFGVSTNFCNVGFFYGDYSEGVSMNSFNSTNCNYGVNTNTANIAGTIIDQLAMVNSQISSMICGVCIEETTAVEVSISNSLFIMFPGAKAIELKGVGHNIHGNTISGVSGATIGISIPANAITSAGSTITGNQISGFASGIKIPAGISSQALIEDNNIQSNTVNFDIGAGAEAEIHDGLLRAFTDIPTCTTALQGSSFYQADGNGGGYNSAAAGGGATPVHIICGPGPAWLNR